MADNLTAKDRRALEVIGDLRLVGPGMLGAEVSYSPAARYRLPQAFTFYGWRLAQRLIDLGLVYSESWEGGTRFGLTIRGQDVLHGAKSREKESEASDD